MMRDYTFFKKSSVILVVFVFAILCRSTAGAADNGAVIKQKTKIRGACNLD